MDKPYILGIGAVNIDLMGRSRAPVILEDSNPGSIGISVGGVTHNICENAAKMGVAVKMITALGDDLFGAAAREHCQRNGIDTRYFYLAEGHTSSIYLSIHQPNGDMAVALSDMSVLQQLPLDFLEQHRPLLEGAAAIVVDAGLPQRVLDFLSRSLGPRTPLFVDPVSTTYAQKLVSSLTGYHTVKPNRLEAEVLAQMEIHTPADLERAASIILDKGAQRLFVSLGKEGVYYADRQGTRRHAKGKPLDQMVNATGAGDAFMAGLLVSWVADFSLDRTLDFAMASAVLALSHQDTINPNMSAALVEQTIRSIRAGDQPPPHCP